MDATTAPHLIPPEMPQYGEDYHIFELMQNLLEQLLIHQPEDPIPFMIEHLQRNNDNVPKIVILGPPASGKTTIAMWLCKHLNSNLVTKENLIEREISHLTEAARKHLETSKISNTLLVNLVKERLTENDCLRRGWILDGIPETREQVLMMQTLGLVPRHVIVLNAPDMVLIERNVGKRIDPVTGEIYHTTFDWPPEPEIQNRLIEPKGISELETAQKLLDYHRNIIRILPSYPKILKTISADQPCVDVFYQALTYVQTSQRCNAPFTPKVLLCGPSGSGKSLQATLLAQKYGLVNETPPIKHAHIPKNWSLFQPSLLTPSEALLSLLPSEVLCGLAVWGPRLLHNRHLLLFYLLQLARFPQPGQTISAPEEDSSVCTVPINILPGREENIEISSAGCCQGGLGVQQDDGLGKRIWKN